MKKAYYAFPALFEADHEDGGVINFEFPDLDSCFGNAPTLEEALVEAREALENVLVWMERDNLSIPEPTDTSTLSLERGQILSLVVADMKSARRSWSERSVNRTVTLPGWLDEKGRQANINFSALLQRELKKSLGIDEPENRVAQ